MSPGEDAKKDTVCAFGLDRTNPIIQAIEKVCACLNLTNTVAVIVDDGTAETFIRGASDALVHQRSHQEALLMIMRLPLCPSKVTVLHDVACVAACDLVGSLMAPNEMVINPVILEEKVFAQYRETFLTPPEKA